MRNIHNQSTNNAQNLVNKIDLIYLTIQKEFDLRLFI